MFATNTRSLSQPPRPFINPDPEHDRQLLAGAMAALSTLAVTWVRRAPSPPSQGHWEDVELAQCDLDDGEVRDG